MVLEGKVSGITKYGAFVDLPENKTGMIHISEISSSFVNNISDYIKENQQVKVKIINIGENGKIALSMKRLEEKKDNKDNKKNKNFNKVKKSFSGPGNFEWRSKKNTSNGSVSFEDMLSKFKQSSEEKMSDLKRFTDIKRSNSRRNSNLPK